MNGIQVFLAAYAQPIIWLAVALVMLILEAATVQMVSIWFCLGAVAAALVLTVGLSPLLGKALGSMFWFLTYRFTAVPILLVAPAFALLGVLVPLGVYRSAARRTVV